MANQTTASTSRRIFFRSRGGSFSAILMANTGDLFQMYTADSSGQPTSPYYPTIDASNPVLINLTLTSSQQTGTVTPTSVTWIVNGVTLTFGAVDGSGNRICNNTDGQGNPLKVNGRFKINNNNLCQLQIIGNLCDIAGGAGFTIQAKAELGDDFVVAHLPVTISEYVDTGTAVVTIAPGVNDTNNFTLKSKGGTCEMRARVFEGGMFHDSGYHYVWEQLMPDANKGNVLVWQTVGTDSPTYTVTEASVGTYADFRVTVYRDAAKTDKVGMDSQGVLDASDPYEIVTTFTSSKNGQTVDDEPSETLEDSYPDGAYIKYTPRLVERGNKTPVTAGVTWNAGSLVASNGLELTNIPFNEDNDNTYKITAEKMRNLGACGEYDFVFGCTIGSGS